jgi:hypothetical protein
MSHGNQIRRCRPFSAGASSDLTRPASSSSASAVDARRVVVYRNPRLPSQPSTRDSSNAVSPGTSHRCAYTAARASA